MRQSDCTQEGQEKRAAALGAMESLFGDLYKSSNFDKGSGDVILMIQAYMKGTPLSPDRNPLLWWRDTGCR